MWDFVPLFFAHILAYDLWFYVSHRLLHHPAFYWIHKAHHAHPFPTVWETYAGHWFESPFQSAGFFLPWVVWTPAAGPALAVAAVCQLRGLARHDSRTTWLIGNHHLLHHELFNVNFGEYWLDLLCDTLDRAPEKRILGMVRV